MPLALSAPRSVSRVSPSIAAAAHTATSLCAPALDGAKWTRVKHCTGTAEAHEEWRLKVDLAQLYCFKPEQVAQLCKGTGLPIKFMNYLATSSETKIVVTFLERDFLLEKHGEAVTCGFESADIGCERSQWVAWLFIGGSYTLLQQPEYEGSKLGLYFIPACGLGCEKYNAAPPRTRARG